MTDGAKAKILPAWLTDGNYSPLEEMRKLAELPNGKDNFATKYKALEFLCLYMCGKPAHNFDTEALNRGGSGSELTVQEKADRFLELVRDYLEGLGSPRGEE
jgi:hypothetical protein